MATLILIKLTKRQNCSFEKIHISTKKDWLSFTEKIDMKNIFSFRNLNYNKHILFYKAAVLNTSTIKL